MIGRSSILLALPLYFAAADLSAQPISPAPKSDEREYVIERGKAANPLRECPDKRIGIKVDGATAQLFNQETGKAIGPELLGYDRDHRWERMKITFWAFSTDGKLLATGASYKRDLGGRVGLQENFGEVRIWEIPGGKLLKATRDGFGFVKAIEFAKDNKTVLVDAEKYFIDGP